MNIHKFTSILLGALLLISLNLQAKEVKNFYINGIDNTEEQALDSSDRLTKAFTEKYGHILKNTEVISIYNESLGAPLDLVESGIQKYELEDLLNGLVAAGTMTSSYANTVLTEVTDIYHRQLVVKVLHLKLLLQSEEYRNTLHQSIQYVDTILLTGEGSTHPPQIPTESEMREFHELAFLLDIGMTVDEIIELSYITGLSGIFNGLSISAINFYSDIDNIVQQQIETHNYIKDQFLPTLNNGGSVNVVAHSQGNFFANNVLSEINQSNNTRLLSVGSPDIRLQANGDFVNLREDAIVRVTQPNLGWNYSNISDFTWNNDIINNLIFDEVELAIQNDIVNSDTKGHNFITAYLKPDSDSREAIIDTMAKHYIEMGGELLKPIGDIDAQLQCDAFEKAYSVNSAVNYDVEFYGDRCLFFTDDHVVDYSIEDQLVSEIYYAVDNLDAYVEYTTYRNFLNNLQSAKADETWRNGYGVTLNSDGNIGCTIADNCVNGNITTVQQCTNMFEALTGLLPSVMNSDVYYNSINQHNRKENKCYFWNQNIDKYIIYNLKTGLVEIKIPQTGFSLSNGVVLNSLPDGISQTEIVIDTIDLHMSGSMHVEMYVNNIKVSHNVSVDHYWYTAHAMVNDPGGFTINNSKIATVRIDVENHNYSDNDEIRIVLRMGGSGGL
jgi:hypothetical protein